MSEVWVVLRVGGLGVHCTCGSSGCGASLVKPRTCGFARRRRWAGRREIEGKGEEGGKGNRNGGREDEGGMVVFRMRRRCPRGTQGTVHTGLAFRVSMWNQPPCANIPRASPLANPYPNPPPPKFRTFVFTASEEMLNTISRALFPIVHFLDLLYRFRDSRHSGNPGDGNLGESRHYTPSKRCFLSLVECHTCIQLPN